MKGGVEFRGFNLVTGWVRNPGEPDHLPIVIVECGGEEIGRLLAQTGSPLPRGDSLRSDEFGFVFWIPLRLLDGQRHLLHFRLASGEELENSPLALQLREERQQVPYSLSDPTGARTLVLAPHPDDESLGCGGTIALHTGAGDPVRVVFLTDGSRGSSDPAVSRRELAARRKREAEAACAVLGVDELEFWGFPDRGLKADNSLNGRLANLLSSWRPQLVYAPSPCDHHPDHRTTAIALWACLQNLGLPSRLAFYEISPPLRPDTLVNVTTTIEAKRRACLCHQSQLEEVPYWEIAEGLNRYRSLTVSGRARFVEAFHLFSPDFISSQPIEAAAFELAMGLPATRASTPALSRSSRADRPSPGRIHNRSRPLVSMVIRTFNRPRLLGEALESAAAQDYPNLELIVVNDGGADVTEVVADIANRIPVKLVQRERRSGPGEAGNAGFARASGDLFCLLDDDDLLYPDHVSSLVESLTSERADFVYSDCLRARYAWSEDGYAAVSAKKLFGGREFDRRELKRNNYIPTVTAMFSRRLWERAGGFRELEMFEDWDLWLRMARHGRFLHVPRVTAEYRLDCNKHSDSPYWRRRIYRRHNLLLYFRATIGDIYRRLWRTG